MSTIRNTVVIFLLLLAAQVFAQPTMYGRWTIAMSPITIASSCTVRLGDTLIVDPGVVINIGANANFIVRGMMQISAPDQSPAHINGAGSPGIFFINTNQINRVTAVITGMYRGLRIRGSTVTITQTEIVSPSSFGIDMSNSTVTLNRSLIDNAGQSGIKMDSSSFLTLNESSVRYCSNHGIYGVRGSAITLDNSTILNNSNHGIWIDGTTLNGRLYVTNSDISQNGQRGIYVNTVNNVMLNKVTLLNNGNDGLYLQNASGTTGTRLTLSGNGNRSPGGSGVFLFNSNVSYLTSSAIDNNVSYGVYAQNSTIGIRYCNFYANQGGDVQGTTIGFSSTTENPQWQMNTGIQRIPSSQSPLIDAGESFIPRDPDGTTADVGHRYYNQNQPPVIQSSIPSDTVLTRDYGNPTFFSVTYTDPNANDTVHVSWFVNNEYAGSGDSISLPFYVPAVQVRAELNDNKPNGLAIRTWYVTVDVDEFSTLPERFSLQSIYPNPTNGAFHIAGNGSYTGVIRLTDLLGRTITTQSFQTQAGNWTIPWQFPAGLPSGSYYLQLPNQKPKSLILLR